MVALNLYHPDDWFYPMAWLIIFLFIWSSMMLELLANIALKVFGAVIIDKNRDLSSVGKDMLDDYSKTTGFDKNPTKTKLNVLRSMRTSSLADVTKLTRVEPLTIVSRDCMNLDYLPDVAQTLLSMFSAYYLQAASVLTSVGKAEVIRALDKLNPDRSEQGLLLSTESNSAKVESDYRYSLTGLSLEADEPHKELVSPSNLAVGKLISVPIAMGTEPDKDGKPGRVKYDTIEISVRLLVSFLTSDSIIKLLTNKGEDTGLVERFHLWRAGRISGIRDLIFCQDLLTEYKKALLEDESATLAEIIRRVNNSKLYGMLSANPSLAAASNLFVISDSVAKELEYKLGGKLSDFKSRERAFDSTYGMIIVVIDNEYSRVRFYTRGLNSYTDLSLKEIKQMSTGKGPDIGEILKSMSMGISPVF